MWSIFAFSEATQVFLAYYFWATISCIQQVCWISDEIQQTSLNPSDEGFHFRQSQQHRLLLTSISLFFFSELPNLCSVSFLTSPSSVTVGATCDASSPSLCLSSDWTAWFIARLSLSPTPPSSCRLRLSEEEEQQPEEEAREKEGCGETRRKTRC